MVDPQVMMPKEEEVEDCLDMPPGFRFHPTDLEIIIHYLEEKTMNGGFSARAIGEIDLNGCEPWDLPSRAKMGEKEWYFFWQRDRKYPTGTRTNRATESGYWKATGKDKEICKGKGCLVGMKKTLVFYLGRAPKGEKTNWVMHEYRLEGSRPLHNDLLRTAKNDWVVCRVFHKNVPAKVSPATSDSYFREGLLDSPNLPPLLDCPQYPNGSRPGHCTTFNDDGNNGVGCEGALSSMPPFSYNRAMTMAMDLPENFSVARLLTPYPAAPSASAFNPQVPPQLLPRMSYLHYNQAGATNPLRGECKAEEYTGNRGATDWTASAGGGDDCRNYDDPGSPSAGPLLDLEKYMWS